MSRRVAFVTGASRGIGRASALALAEQGFDVVLTARTVTGSEVHEYSPNKAKSLRVAMPGSLEETAAAIRERGREALVVPMDLLERKSVEAAVAQAQESWGAIDLLLNNAVYQGPGTMERLLDLEPDHVETLLRGNVVHQLLLVQRVLPGMVERGGGTIINMVSAAGMSDPPAPPESGGWGYAYGASKAALIRMGGIVNVEHAGQGIRFFSVDPGLILTESMKAQGLTEELARQFGGAPPEVPAAVIGWLATSPDADRWHGQVVHAQELCRELGLLPGWPEPR